MICYQTGGASTLHNHPNVVREAERRDREREAMQHKTGPFSNSKLSSTKRGAQIPIQQRNTLPQ